MADWLLYAPAHQLNEATRYYIGTLGRAAEGLGLRLRHVETLRGVPRDADALVVECKSAVKLLLSRPRARVWLWQQGIVPEEARLQFGSRWREALWNRLERLTLPRMQGVVMVSQAMREHYGAKYGLHELPSFVMPCVNAALDASAFDEPGKYTTPRFVYAGSLHAWQCFDLTLEVFRRVRERLPAATLLVLTGDQAGAKRRLAEAGVEGVDVDFVPQERLQATLRRFKYGFVLRRPHAVNRVATPTKVSSYMAAGVVPVMTTAVADYAREMAKVQPLVLCSTVEPQAIAEAILRLEAQPLQPRQVARAYGELFERYFDHARYLPALRAFLGATGLGRPAKAGRVA